MIKKILIAVGSLFLIILVILAISVHSSYKSKKISQEKCGDLSKQQGIEYIYKDGAGCIAKETIKGQKNYERDLRKQYGADGAYLVQVDKASSVNIKGQISSDIEFYKEEKGSYSGFTPKIKYTVNNEKCTQEIKYVISPDGHEYAIYIPLCSNKDKIYCLDSTNRETVAELPKSSIENIEKNYSCK